MIDSDEVQLLVRNLVLDIPALAAVEWAWEGVAYTPKAGVDFIQESFSGGPAFQATIGQFGEVEGRPTYRLYPHAKAGSGQRARRYADAILRALPPGLQLALSTGDTLFIESDPAPSAPGPVGRSAEFDGFVTLLVTIPMWLRTDNSI